MKILVTGGAGFIGHNVARLLQDEHHVTVMDSFTDYGIVDPAEMRPLFAERLSYLKCEILTGDIRSPVAVNTAMWRNPDVVIHLASFPRAKVVNADPVLGADVMITGLMNLLTAAKKNGVRRFVYVSSSMVYGEFSNGVGEAALCNPLGGYAIMKYSGELLVKDFCTRNGMEFVIVRPSAVYGPLDIEDRVVSKFLTNAMRDLPITVRGGSEILDFTYVVDAADGLCRAATFEAAANKIYNITRGSGRTLLDAAYLAREIAGSAAKLNVTDRDLMFPRRGSLSIHAAKTDLGFTPRINIEEGFLLYHSWLTRP